MTEATSQRVAILAHVPKSLATWCANCEAIYSALAKRCPACNSPHGYPLQALLDRVRAAMREI